MRRHQARAKDGGRGVIVKTKAKKKERLVPFDMAAFLDSPESIAEYLTQVLAAGEPDELLRALGHIAEARTWRRSPRTRAWGGKASTRHWYRARIHATTPY